MWNRWRKKIKSLFSSGEKETEKERKRNYQVHQTFKTKVKYQYPNHSRFRFPVISDQEIERSVSQRKQKNDRYHQRDQAYNEDFLKKEETDQLKEPFKPSQVPSPIYGYQQRSTRNEIVEVPAYVRKSRTKSKQTHQTNSDSKMISGKTHDTKNEIKDNLAKKQVTEDIHNQEKMIQEAKYVRKRDTKKSNHTKTRHKKSAINNIPFNVIMTPRDKKKVMDRTRAGKSESKESNNYLKPKDSSLSIHLLNESAKTSHEDEKWVRNQWELLDKTFKHFNVKAKVVNATQGPSVTRFEVQPELGVKVSRVRNLSDDIKLNMAAKDIRIEAPIPGKNTIGIEVPNLKPQMVGLQQILDTLAFQQSKSPLTIGLGLNVEGEPLVTNISKMPHGLIAGATGSGKSVCINTILISLLYKASHEDIKFLLIDPKMVELAPYNGIPHLVAPVITDVKAATAALKWAVNEMEDRYEKFVREGTRDIERYNEKMTRENRRAEKMPFMVIVIDELADLMMISPQDVEDAISRIAQKARACGMHLLLATQRPSVDVITGLIKANIPTRIAFSVSSQVDSRTIIDTSGAERLLGKGDMLLIENGSGKSVRLQGAFVSDEEIERVTNHARAIAPANYLRSEVRRVG